MEGTDLSVKLMETVPAATRSLMGILVLVIPCVMLVLGLIGLLCPPKEANWLIGYRIRRAMRSEDAWFFAQKLRGFTWGIAGLAMGIPSVLLRNLMRSANMDYCSRMTILYALIQICVLLLSMLVMRIVILAVFDRDGNRRRPTT